MHNRSVKKSEGITLVEVMIALVLLGIISLAVSSFFNMTNSSNNDIESQSSRDALRSALILAFDHPNICAGIFNGPGNVTIFDPVKAASATGLPLKITLNKGSTKIISGDPAGIPAPTPRSLPNYEVQYEYVVLENATRVGPDPANTANTLYEGAVVMKLDKIQQPGTPATGGTSMPLQTVGTLFVSVTPTNIIAACYSVIPVNDACTNIGGVPNPSPQPGCLIKSPCPTGQIFSGNDALGHPLCQISVLSCGPNQALVPNIAGIFTCTPVP